MQIFISYRQADSEAWVRLFYERLLGTPEFRDGGVFMDVASIRMGADIVRRIEAAMAVSAVVLVVIGDRWLTVANDKGKRRLDEKDDPVRTEIRLCRTLGVPFLPVLVGGARMPAKANLPAAIRGLADMNAVRVNHNTFDADFERLLVTVREKAAERTSTVVEKVKEPRPEDFFAVGWHYASKSDYPGARVCFQAAVAKQPNFARAYGGLAWCSQLEANSMIRRRNYGFAEELLEDAEQHIKTGLQHDDTDTTLFVQSGYVRKEIAQTFLNIHNEVAALQHRLPQWEAQAQKAFDGARTHFKMALGIDPQDISAINGLASLELILGNYAQVIQQLEPLVKAHPGYAAAQFDLASAYYRRFGELLQRDKPPAREMEKCMKGFHKTCGVLADMLEDPDAEQLPPAARDGLLQMIQRMTQWTKLLPTLVGSAAASK